MKLHGNARTCPNSRRLLVGRIVEEGWSLTEAAATAGEIIAGIPGVAPVVGGAGGFNPPVVTTGGRGWPVVVDSGIPLLRRPPRDPERLLVRYVLELHELPDTRGRRATAVDDD